MGLKVNSARLLFVSESMAQRLRCVAVALRRAAAFTPSIFVAFVLRRAAAISLSVLIAFALSGFNPSARASTDAINCAKGAFRDQATALVQQPGAIPLPETQPLPFLNGRPLHTQTAFEFVRLPDVSSFKEFGRIVLDVMDVKKRRSILPLHGLILREVQGIHVTVIVMSDESGRRLEYFGPTYAADFKEFDLRAREQNWYRAYAGFHRGFRNFGSGDAWASPSASEELDVVSSPPGLLMLKTEPHSKVGIRPTEIYFQLDPKYAPIHQQTTTLSIRIFGGPSPGLYRNVKMTPSLWEKTFRGI